MAIQLSPGVQVVEKDFTQIIPSLATTRGAYAGKFKWGPVLEPTLITSENELVSKFRKPDDNNYLSFFTAANFLAYSNNMLVTRIDTGDSRNSAARPSGPVTSVVMDNGGSGYRAVPTVEFSDPSVVDGVPATGVAVLSGGALVIEGVVISDGGVDYQPGDVITLSAPDVKVLNIGTGLYETLQATATVSTVDGITGAITAITITNGGGGYINNATVLSIASTSGVGASITITPAASSIASVRITNGGSGYTANQEIEVIIVAADGDDGDGATATGYPTVSGTKILNSTHYSNSFADGQATKGEWSGKYPGALGNSLRVSMCDAANWQAAATGTIYARKHLEDVEDSREKIIARVFGTNLATIQEQLDVGKVLRTSTSGAQKRVGEVLSLDTVYAYRKVTFVSTVASLEYQSIDMTTSTADEYTGSGTIFSTNQTTTITGLVSTVGLAAGMVLNKTSGTGAFGGRTVILSVDSATEITIKSVSANTTGSVSFTANSYNTTTRSLSNREIVIGDKNVGFVDGYYKVHDALSNQYVLDNKTMLIRLTDVDSVLHGDIAIGDVIKNGTNDVHGTVESVEQFFVVRFTDVNDNEIYNEQFNTEWKYKSQFNSAPGTSSYAKVRGSSNDELHIVIIDRDGKIAGTGAVLEKFANVSKASDVRNSSGRNNYYKDVINSSSRWIWWTDHPVGDINAGMGGTPNWGTPSDGAVAYHPLNNAVTTDLSGGYDSVNATSGNYIDAYTLYADDEVYDISLIPVGEAPASVATWVIQNVAETRKDCVVFVSGPKLIGTASSIATQIVEYRNQLPSSSYSVMDSTWKYQYDKYNDKYRWVPMNADTAGLCARTDEVADPWFSPGGYNRGIVKNIIKIAYNPNKAQRDELYKAGVNPIVTFPGQGTILFGDKTMQTKASAFDRINVRRLFIVLEKAISTASKFQLFEFNDPFTRAQFRNIVEPFLRDVQGRRGIIDFRVRCDESNNTPEIIDSNQFVADIYIKPNRSINYITLNFIAAKTGASFEELGV